MKLPSILFLLFGCFSILSLNAKSLLSVAEELSKTNPYQAYQILKAIPTDQFSETEYKQYKTIREALLFFRLPIHKIGLSDFNISAMVIDGQDLWLGDWLGSLVRYNLDTAEAFVARKGRPSKTLRSVNHILVEPNEVWAATNDGIITYNKKNGTVSNTANPNIQGQPMMLIRHNKKLFLAIKNAGIYEWGGENFVISAINDIRLLTCQVLFNHEGKLWAGTTEGLYVYQDEKWQPIEAFTGKNITAIASQDTNLWVATQSTGLIAYNTASEKSVTFSFSYPWITTVLIMEKTIFVGMYKGGLAEIHEGSVDQERLNQLSPALLRIGSLAYHEPYLIVGTLGDAVFFIHNSLF